MSLDIDLRAPIVCPHCGGITGSGDDLFSANYTHNVIPMWSKAGVYEALYESDGHVASRYIDVLDRGVAETTFTEVAGRFTITIPCGSVL